MPIPSNVVRRAALSIAAMLLAGGRAYAATPVVPLASFAEPAISPDGSEIAFVSGGDIWTVPAGGGVAHLLVSHPATESRPLYSPDGSKLAFVSTRTGNGDVYVLTLASGELTRLTCDDGAEQLDGWSYDGKYVYFSATSADLGAANADVYRVRAAGGTPMPVSAERYTNEFNAAPSPDGKVLAMAAGANSRDWWRNGHSNWNESHVWLRRERKGGPAYEELTEPGAREMWPMWGAGGRVLYCVSDRGGKPQNLVAYDLAAAAAAAKAAAKADAAKEKAETDNAGGEDAKAVKKDAKGKKKSAPPKVWLKPEPVTRFSDGRVLWPSISHDGRTIVFERDFGIWKVSVGGDAKAEPEPVQITLRGSAAADAESDLNFTGGFRDLAVSPDGKKLAFAVHGEIFAASAKDGGRAVRVTSTPSAEGQPVWAPDSRRLVFVAERDGGQNVHLYDFATQQESALTTADAYDSCPTFSPDGKTLLFRRNGSELRLMDVATKKDRVLIGNLSGGGLPPFDDAASPYSFSPKGQWLAYIDSGRRGYDNVFVVSTIADKPEPKQVTFFANTGSNAVTWGGDGRSLLFGTGMRTEEFQLAKIDVVARAPNFGEDQFRGLFEDELKSNRPNPLRPTRPGPDRAPPAEPATGPATKPSDKPPADPASRPVAVSPTTLPAALPGMSAFRKMLPSIVPEQFVFDDLRRRTSLLPVGVDVDAQVVSPDGKWCVFVGTAAGRQNVYGYPLDNGGEPANVRQLTTTTGGKSSLCFGSDAREVYYLDGGQIRSLNIDSRAMRDINVSAPMEADFAREKMEVARQAWTFLKLNFYDPAMHGADWNAVRAKILPRAAGAKTADELRRILSLMIGELNASHLGVGGRYGSGPTIGRLGLRFDRATYEKSGELKVTEVLAGGPADQAGIKAGSVILKVDADPVDADANLDKLLDRKIGRRVVLRVRPTPENHPPEMGDAATKPAEERDVPVRPVDTAAEKTLVYRDWTERNRAYVAKASGGRLGYVHIADMGKTALARLNADLDAEASTRDGVVVDVRANTGGFASPYVLDVLSRKNYLTITRRGSTESPARVYVGQRALDLPTVLVTNRQSISDAENFTEGYRALKLGKVVGEPTAGGVIFTSDVSLMDGTVFRIPASKVIAHDGKSLEGDGRPVDVLVRRPLGQAAVGKDNQLDAAVRELIKQVDRKKGDKVVTAPKP